MVPKSDGYGRVPCPRAEEPLIEAQGFRFCRQALWAEARLLAADDIRVRRLVCATVALPWILAAGLLAAWPLWPLPRAGRQAGLSLPTVELAQVPPPPLGEALLESFAYASYLRASCLRPSYLFIYRTRCALEVAAELGVDVDDIASWTLPLVTKAASHALGEWQDSHVYAAEAMVAYEAAGLATPSNETDAMTIAQEALGQQALDYMSRSAARWPAGDPAPALCSNEYADGRCAWLLLKAFPCSRADNGSVSCPEGASRSLPMATAALEAVTALRSKEFIAHNATGAGAPCTSWPTDSDAEITLAGDCTLENASGVDSEVARASWRAALRHSNAARELMELPAVDCPSAGMPALWQAVFGSELHSTRVRVSAAHRYMQAASCMANAHDRCRVPAAQASTAMARIDT